MVQYLHMHPESLIRAVEFAETKGQTTCFFHLAPKADRAAVEDLIARSKVAQHVASEATLNGEKVIVTQGPGRPEQLLKAFYAQGESFQPPEPKKEKFNPWKWRGITSIVGQSLQMVSSFRTVGTKKDKNAILGFATLNLIANGFNIIFGAQHKQDKHQLRLLKTRFNESIAPHLDQGAKLPDPEDQRLKAYEHLDPPKTFGQRIYATFQKYSVSGGEIGLRVIGSASLAFPGIWGWKKMGKVLREGGTLTERARNLFHAGKNSNEVTFTVGLLMLTGKFVSFLAKEPDPYNPKPPSLIDQVREKYMFRLSSLIEGYAAGKMAHDRFTNQNIELFGKQYPDHFGGWGNVVFVGGYAVRYFAKYGTLEVNMPELYAHIGDALAKLPREQLPAQLAETAVTLKQHFHDKPLELGTIYQALVTELEKHHKITLPVPSEHAAPTARPIGIEVKPSRPLKPHTRAHAVLREATLGEEQGAQVMV